MTVKPAVQTVEGIVGHQRIDGFGCSMKPFDNSDMYGADLVTTPPADQTAILAFLFDQSTGMGLTRMRGYVRGASSEYQIEETNDNADPQVTDETALSFSRVDATAAIATAARPLGLEMLWFSPVNRPTWMGAGSANLTADPAEYSEWVLAMARRFSDLGEPVDMISIVNEPAYTRNKMTGATQISVIADLIPRLQAEGLNVPLILCDDIRASDATALAPTLLANAYTKSNAVAIGTHLYDEAHTNMTALREIAAANRLPLWMTEASASMMNTITGSGWSSGSAIDWAELMHTMLVDYNVSAIDYLWGWFGEEDSSQLVRLNHTGTTYDGYELLDVAYHMGQWSKYVRPGSRRVAAEATNGALVSAFMSDTSRVIVAVNPTGSPITTTITADMLAGRTSMTATRSKSGAPGVVEKWASLADEAVTGSTISPTLASISVTTFVTA